MATAFWVFDERRDRFEWLDELETFAEAVVPPPEGPPQT
jgi:hypothetical protein